MMCSRGCAGSQDIFYPLHREGGGRNRDGDAGVRGREELHEDKSVWD